MSDNLQLQPPLQPHFAAAQELDLEQASFTFDGGTGFEQNFGSSWSYTMENPASLVSRNHSRILTGDGL